MGVDSCKIKLCFLFIIFWQVCTLCVEVNTCRSREFFGRARSLCVSYGFVGGKLIDSVLVFRLFSLVSVLVYVNEIQTEVRCIWLKYVKKKELKEECLSVQSQEIPKKLRIVQNNDLNGRKSRI